MEIGGTESVFELISWNRKGDSIKDIREKYLKVVGKEIGNSTLKVYLGRLVKRKLIKRVSVGKYARITDTWVRKPSSRDVENESIYVSAVRKLGGKADTRQIWRYVNDHGHSVELYNVALSLKRLYERKSIGQNDFIDRYYIV